MNLPVEDVAPLFTPLDIRGVTLPNRIAVSPLCMYSAEHGLAQPWHFAHLSTFARGKAGLVFTEATAVEARGRITPKCLGIWTDEQAAALEPITEFIRSMGCVPGIQLAHAGRKASTRPPFVARPGQPLTEDDTDLGEGPWDTVAPSAEPVGPNWHCPREMTAADLATVKTAFADAALRSVNCGFSVIELHMAHGYLLHSFLSPLGNHRQDEYGGSLENRMRFPLEVCAAVRKVIPDSMPLFTRISAIDGPEGGWTLEDSIVFSKKMAAVGIDVVDCSSGGIAGAPRFRSDDSGKPLTRSSAREPGFQVPFTERIGKETSVKTMAVGVIVDPHQANEIIKAGRADLVALGREIMHDPFWPLHAAQALEQDPDFNMWPAQYAWAVDRRAQIQQLNRSQRDDNGEA